LDPQTFRQYVALSEQLSSASSNIKEKSKAKGSPAQQSSPIMVNNSSVKFVIEDEEKRCKRVFIHLEALCVTNEARESLWKWQLQYARQIGSENLLPSGGKLATDEKVGWIGRVGRVI